MAMGGYSIIGYGWLFYYWLSVAIILLVIVDYFIIGLSVVIILLVIGGYSINDY
jgi:hypothetical protein